MKRVAILGAGGFIGTRAVEMLHLGELADVRPVVRSASHIARLSRFQLDCRTADARNRDALVQAFAGCDSVVHAVAGPPETILDTIHPCYDAAEIAGVRRLIYLSSASVHGQAPPKGTLENSPLSDRQPIAYNNAKVKAESRLLRRRKQSSVEVIILRPGIVFGPRSFWVGSFADGVLNGAAYRINGGRGICNSIYVDNLVHAIWLSVSRDGVGGEAFFVGDAEQVTWADLYRPIAKALGCDFDTVPELPVASASDTKDLFDRITGSRGGRLAAGLLPQRWRKAFYAGVARFQAGTPSVWDPPKPEAPRATLEMSMLFSCAYKLPHAKSERMLGYQPIVSFNEAIRRTIDWMEFAGYPVIT